MIDTFVSILLCLLVLLEGAIVYLICRMIRAINIHNEAVKSEVPFEKGGIDLSFFNRPRSRRATTFTQKSERWIKNHERWPEGGEIIGK